jgi:hypothetical protein
MLDWSENRFTNDCPFMTECESVIKACPKLSTVLREALFASIEQLIRAKILLIASFGRFLLTEFPDGFKRD